MPRKIIPLTLIILSLGIFAGIFYLNEVLLPIKIKASIIKGIEDATQKKVLLDSLRFNIFKGLVLEHLIIYDDKSVILNIKKVADAFNLNYEIIKDYKEIDQKLKTITSKSGPLFVEVICDDKQNIIEPDKPIYE